MIARFRDPNLLAKASDFNTSVTWTRSHTNPSGAKWQVTNDKWQVTP